MHASPLVSMATMACAEGAADGATEGTVGPDDGARDVEAVVAAGDDMDKKVDVGVFAAAANSPGT